jgi:hypothetical protein
MARETPMRTLLLASLLMVLPRQVAAASKEQCVAAYDGGQKLRAAGKLVETRAEFLTCAADDCPALIHDDCIRWLREIEPAVPTLIPSVRMRDGRDVSAARVYVDGQLALTHVDGAPVALDAGEHVLRVEVAGAPPVERRIVVNEGERSRIVYFTIDGPAPIVGRLPPRRGGFSPWVFILGGTGAALLAGGGVVDGLAWADLAHDRSSCAPSCTEDAKNSLVTRFAVGDALLGGGIVLLGGATAAYFLAPSHKDAPAPAPVSLFLSGRALRLTVIF